jgi:hypothetical protein
MDWPMVPLFVPSLAEYRKSANQEKLFAYPHIPEPYIRRSWKHFEKHLGVIFPNMLVLSPEEMHLPPHWTFMHSNRQSHAMDYARGSPKVGSYEIVLSPPIGTLIRSLHDEVGWL